MSTTSFNAFQMCVFMMDRGYTCAVVFLQKSDFSLTFSFLTLTLFQL